jgi:hypothetical protein
MYIIFWWENLKVKRPLGSPRSGWEGNIGMDLRESKFIYGTIFNPFR